jgi:zinc/manganese transport system substrate-binding protein
MLFHRILALVALTTLFATAAFANESKKTQVIASFSLLADIAQQIGGDAVQVSAFVGPDQDAHAFQPTPDDAKKLATADLLILNGLGLEGWQERLIQSSGFHGKIVVASSGIVPRKNEENEIDPHAWQNLSNGRIYAKNIAKALTEVAPSQAKAIGARAAAYDAEIVKLDRWVRDELRDIPKPRRKIITSHDAFGYFGAAYGISFLAPQGMNTESEPSAKEVANLIRQIKNEGVKEVFIENMANPRLIEQMAKDSGAKMGGELFSDALSKPDGQAPTYFGMFRNNVPKMKKAMMEIGK